MQLNKLLIIIAVIVLLILIIDRSNLSSTHLKNKQQELGRWASLLNIKNGNVEKDNLEHEIIRTINAKKEKIKNIDHTNTKVTRESQLEREYLQWVENFQAPFPEDQQFCKDFFLLKNGGNSQFYQDKFLFHNIFKYWPMKGKKGFYVDGGSQDWKHISNGYIFDRCLGWQGICIEAMSRYREGFEKGRTCKFVQKCLNDKREIQTHRHGADVEQVECLTFNEIVGNQTEIDFLSLDIEGAEFRVLKEIDVSKYKINVILVEDVYSSSRKLDFLLTSKGFNKYQHMAIDSVYTNRLLKDTADNVYYNDEFQRLIDENDIFREQMRGMVEC
eukprot:TRINITY_DN7746_c0_g1_i1.p1 TRINITY_DN7746_c0_g1~~TRINITY_DN7746_c0_g1_i1.p1  ORF type:complete len:330 (+),score=84.10 TRINITY_DN7746_c0_g1_i1:1-990(+)